MTACPSTSADSLQVLADLYLSTEKTTIARDDRLFVSLQGDGHRWLPNFSDKVALWTHEINSLEDSCWPGGHNTTSTTRDHGCLLQETSVPEEVLQVTLGSTVRAQILEDLELACVELLHVANIPVLVPEIL